MIDDIVEMILKEARGRKGFNAVSKIYSVKELVDRRLVYIMDDLELKEGRKKEDENKV